MKNLTLRQLRVFVALAEGTSFSSAATRLNISQPAVSMLVRQLEADAGLPLLLRQRQRMELTRAGAVLLQHARGILEQVRVAEEALVGLATGTVGHLRLGVVPTANYFAPRLLMEFQRQMPGMTFTLAVGRRDDILGMLRDHRIDVAITGHPPGEADVEVEAFARHPHCIVAAPDHPLADQRRVTWAQLRNEPFIFREAGSATRQFLEQLLQSQSLKVSVKFELAGNETVKQAVMSGMGISFMSGHAIQVEVAAGRIAVLDVTGLPKWLDWCLLNRREMHIGGLPIAFREFVLREGSRIAACVPWADG